MLSATPEQLAELALLENNAREANKAMMKLRTTIADQHSAKIAPLLKLCDDLAQRGPTTIANHLAEHADAFTRALKPFTTGE